MALSFTWRRRESTSSRTVNAFVSRYTPPPGPPHPQTLAPHYANNGLRIAREFRHVFRTKPCVGAVHLEDVDPRLHPCRRACAPRYPTPSSAHAAVVAAAVLPRTDLRSHLVARSRSRKVTVLHEAMNDRVAARMISALARRMHAVRTRNRTRLLLAAALLTARLVFVGRSELAELVGTVHAPLPIALGDEAERDGIWSRDEWVHLALHLLGGEPTVFADLSLRQRQRHSSIERAARGEVRSNSP